MSGKTGEQYDLMIAGGDYYTKVEGVTTSTGQSDAYKITGTGIIIDFDQQKTGKYSLLTDNFQDTLTGTIFLSGITATPELQKLSYDWYKVLQKTNDAILYQVDSNNDGVYDITSNFSATPKSIQAKSSISGYVIGDTNASMAGWKVLLEQDNNQSCKENKKNGERKENQKNEKERECRDHEDGKDNQKNRENKEDRENKVHHKEIFAITDKKGYYRFTNLSPGTYSVSIESQKNWTTIKPQNNIYNITLTSGQNIINLNFENTFLKGKNK